jgi:predicted GH43/DUF377 family glycosyl hydrolase
MPVLYLLFLFYLPLSLWGELVNLEDGRQGFVMETHQIRLRGHPNAFNPSIIRWNGALLMSFREIRQTQPLSPWPYDTDADSRIGLVWLDDNFQPIGKAQLLKPIEQRIGPSRSEDARLILCGNTPYIIYSDNCNEKFSDGGFRIYAAEISYCEGKFSLKNVVCLRNFEGENPQRREKNWAPFAYYDELFFAYSLIPHRILRYVPNNSICDTVATTTPKIDWCWGELRGGTPAIPIDDDHYLAFFHSSMDMRSQHSHGELSLHYFMGAYLFQRHPPFAITKVSPEPLVGPGFYCGNDYVPYWKPVRVVFPGGALIEGEIIWLAYGRQDHEIWIAKLDRRSLLESLVEVRSGEK